MKLVLRLAIAAASLMYPLTSDAIVFKSVKDYGAKGDGRADDTAAFNKCLAANQTCWVDPAIFVVGDVKMNSGNRLQGMGMQDGSVGDSKPTTRPVLYAKIGSKAIIDISKATYVAVVGMHLNCGNSKIDGFTTGAEVLIENVSVADCGVGFGSYTTGARVYNAMFENNEWGIKDLVDSLVVNSVFIANHVAGMALGPGANAVNISNSRFEWNDGFGLWAFGLQEGKGNNGNNGINISNCFFDRNGMAGLALTRSEGVSISNSTFHRNGSKGVAPDGNSQIYLSNSRNISITGGVSKAGRGDSGEGLLSPANVFGYDRSPSAFVTIVGMVTGGRYNAASNPMGGYLSSVAANNAYPAGWTVLGVTP